LQALRSDAQHPAQFVAERDGVLSFVVSDSQGTRETLIAQVMAQARQLLKVQDLELLYCATEKRATFACTPQLKRPGAQVSPGVWACGDYIAGPYPATLEGAVRSGLQVLEQIAEAGIGQRL
jgi:predicted NAD/FAD-dependent oxidoreductase